MDDLSKTWQHSCECKSYKIPTLWMLVAPSSWPGSDNIFKDDVDEGQPKQNELSHLLTRGLLIKLWIETLNTKIITYKSAS